MNKPNILFIITDDQRFDTIHALGCDIKTPELDALVAEGSAFTHAHIPGGSVGAVCMPSRAMINTGRSMFHIDGCGEEINISHTMIGETFKNAGYHTHGIGKWHNGTNSYARNFTGGANIFFGGMWDHWNVPVCDYHADGLYENKIRYTDNFIFSNKIREQHCDRINAGIHSTELLSGAAIDFINNYDSEKPFYLNVCFLAPHDPRTMPDKYKNMYKPEDMAVPVNFSPMHFIDYGESKGRDEVLAKYPRTPEEIKQHLADYYAMISHLDEWVGNIIGALKQKGLYENTIIVFTADNGLAVGQHGLMGKQNLYDHSVRIPLIFSGPGIPKGKRFSQYAYLFDIYPTLCELCGIEIPISVEGKSIMPVMQKGEAIRDTLYLAYKDKIRGVKTDRYKLLEYRAENISKTQLFDLTNDPAEMDDLSKNPEYENIKTELTDLLIGYNKEWDDEKHIVGKGFWEKYARQP